MSPPAASRNPQRADQGAQLAQLRLARLQLARQIPSDADYAAEQDATRALADAQREQQLAQLDGVDKAIAELESQLDAPTPAADSA